MATDPAARPQRIALIRRKHSATGGAELYTDRLIEGLAASGATVDLFAENWPPSGARLHPIRETRSRALRPLLFARAVRDAVAAAGPFDRVLSLERTLQQDVYRAGDGVHRAWLECRGRFRPAWSGWFSRFDPFHRSMLALEAEVFDPANTSRVIVNSEKVCGEILRYFSFPKDRIHLVRNGIALDRFEFTETAREQARARFGVGEDDFVLAFVGSGWARKGLVFALKAVEKIWANDSQVRFIVAGADDAKKLPPRITSAGAVRAVEEIYFAADLFLFPPIYEPSANVCFEALAAGLPVITTASNGAAEIIAEGVTGHVLDRPDDIDGMIAAIRYWRNRMPYRVPRCALPDLSIERNVRETLAVLDLPR